MYRNGGITVRLIRLSKQNEKERFGERTALFHFAIGVWGGVTEKRLLSIYVNSLSADYI